MGRARKTRRRAIQVAPRADRHSRDRLLSQWWDAYGDRRRALPLKGEEPTIVENFLRSSLARRLDLRLPPREQTAAPKELLARELGLLFGI